MPEEPFPIASLFDRDPRGVGWSETRFRESFRERRLSSAEETDNACERDGHLAAPVTTVRSGRSSVRASDSILVENSFKAPMPSHFCVNEMFFNKAVTHRSVLAGWFKRKSAKSRTEFTVLRERHARNATISAMSESDPSSMLNAAAGIWLAVGKAHSRHSRW
jgi:hypothetical protein